MRNALGVLLVSFCLLTSAVAQDATGRIVGTVVDATGAVVPNAKVAAVNVDTGNKRETVTDSEGAYQIVLLPIGRYQLTVEATGFRKSTIEPQKLEINQSLKLDVKLEVGSSTETVEVVSTASGVETVNATLGHSVTSNQIVSAPLNGRNTLDLALLQPGVIPNLSGNGSFSVAGSRGDSVTYLLDGGVNNNLLDNRVVYNPNPDAVEEFRILTSNYGAEYGRSGGGIVSVVTKSGTNQVHGSAYDYLRNDALNANRFFNNANGLPREILKRNQFGGTLGAPIVIPKVLNGRDKAFFFFSYQGQRQSQLTTTSKIAVFTPSELTGDFSLSNASHTGPDKNVVAFLQDNPFYQPNAAKAAQGIIDPSRIASVAQSYIKNSLLASSGSGFLTSQGSATDNRNEYTIKPDFMLSSRDRLSFTLGHFTNPTLSPFVGANVPGYPNTTSFARSFGSLDYTRTFSASLVNQFRFNAQRSNQFQSVPAHDLPKATDLGIGVISDHPTGPPNLSFDSGMTTGFSVQGPTSLIDNTYNWSDTLSWTKGHHALKVGGWYTPYQDNTVYDFYINGEFYFYGASGSSFSGNDRADFLMGLPDEYLQFPEAPSNIRQHNIGFFVQDEWKVRRNLTLTLGLRYEYSSPKLDTQGRSFALNFGQQSTVFTKAPKGLVFPGDPGVPAGANFPDKNDFAPRFGFAWDPKGNGKTSIRGGFGVFYDVLKAEDNLQFNGQAPFFGFADLFFDPLEKNPTAEVNYMTKPFVAVGQPNPFPSRPPAKDLDFAAAGFLPAGGGGVYFVNPHLRTPYIYQYNLSVQRELVRDTTLEVSYAGSSSHKLTGLLDSNPMLLGSTKRIYNLQSGLPAASSFSYLDTFDNVGSANYNGLLVGLNKRLAEMRGVGRLQFQVSYTYGKTIDNISGFRARTSRVPTYDWNHFRAPSDYDLTHVLAISGDWELPFYKLGGPRRLTSGWRLFPILTYRSGQTLDVTANISRTATRTGPSGLGDPNLVRPDLAGQIVFFDPHLVQQASTGRTGNFYFDPAAFDRTRVVALQNNTDPAKATYGNLGRNAFRGPDRINGDLAISKITDLAAERVKLEIRGEFFNLTNHTQFSNPSTTITSSTFGQVSSTADPRIIQLAVRLMF